MLSASSIVCGRERATNYIFTLHTFPLTRSLADRSHLHSLTGISEYCSVGFLFVLFFLKCWLELFQSANVIYVQRCFVRSNFYRLGIKWRESSGGQHFYKFGWPAHILSSYYKVLPELDIIQIYSGYFDWCTKTRFSFDPLNERVT